MSWFILRCSVITFAMIGSFTRRNATFHVAWSVWICAPIIVSLALFVWLKIMGRYRGIDHRSPFFIKSPFFLSIGIQHSSGFFVHM
jgi:hypothetical protein